MTSTPKLFIARWTPCLLLVVSGALLAQPAETGKAPPKALPESTPWNLPALRKAPEMRWIDERSPIRSLAYAGPELRGRPTRAFALYATPETLSGKPARKDQSLPTVVLVHGGGGTAFPEWVKLWAARGYAAIAMDLAGCGANRKRMPDGGPGQGHDTKFGAIDSPTTDQWPYHAVANVILAHSLVRSFPEVDAKRTAITGISWGGYLTCIVAGLDPRFRAAVPVYGCGFLHTGSVWDGEFAKMNAKQRASWIELWEPSRYIGAASMPVFFVNGTNDFAYWLEAYARTYQLVKSPREYRITVNMPHGHRAGWAPKEIATFIDSKLLGKAPLARIDEPKPRVRGEAVQPLVASYHCASEHPLRHAELHYTVDQLPNRERKWTTRPGKIAKGSITFEAPPQDARIWFVTARDDRGLVTSSPLVFAK